MSHPHANTVTLDDALAVTSCDRDAMAGKRPRVVLNITPRLLQDTLSLALSAHADVVDLVALRDAASAPEAFDVALVSGGSLPDAVAAHVVIDVDGLEGVPSLDSLHERLRAINVTE